jgi:hypothetical protein
MLIVERQGSGMRLAISHSIVEAHGGQLWAKKATCSLWLPQAYQGKILIPWPSLSFSWILFGKYFVQFRCFLGAKIFNRAEVKLVNLRIGLLQNMLHRIKLDLVFHQ